MSYLKTIECSIDEFYRELRKVQKQTEDRYLLTFIDCLLASCDYDSFYRVMVREGKKRKLIASAEEKAESKSERKSAEIKLAKEGKSSHK